jgi:S-DNA-T family DNA segregation ATPase FtsK/SpoIIIE
VTWWIGERLREDPPELVVRPKIERGWLTELAIWTARGVARLLLATGRHLWLTGALIVGVYVWWRLGWPSLAVVAGLSAASLIAWWLADPASFRVWVAVPTRSSWRRAIMYRRRWQAVMVLAGLGGSYAQRDYLPSLVSVRSDATADRLLVRLRAGQQPEDLEQAADRLAHSFAARDCRIAVARPGWVRLVFTRRDPLAERVTPAELPDTVTVADLGGLVLGVADTGATLSGRRLWTRDRLAWLTSLAWARLVSGFWWVWSRVRHLDRPAPLVLPRLRPARASAASLLGRGQAWRLRLLGTHVLIVGATGAGKGSVLWSILRSLHLGIRTGFVRVLAIDPKGGMELAAGAPMFARFAYQLTDAADLLDHAVAIMRARTDRLRGLTRLHTPTPDEPLVVVLVDELAALASYVTDRALKQRITAALQLLLSQGRAVGVVVVAAVQDPRKDTVPFRDLFPTRIAMRLTEPEMVDLALGDGARDRGAYADLIPDTQPGTAYVRLEGIREPQRVRAAWVSDDDIRALAELHLPETIADLAAEMEHHGGTR